MLSMHPDEASRQLSQANSKAAEQAVEITELRAKVYALENKMSEMVEEYTAQKELLKRDSSLSCSRYNTQDFPPGNRVSTTSERLRPWLRPVSRSW